MDRSAIMKRPPWRENQGFFVHKQMLINLYDVRIYTGTIEDYTRIAQGLGC